MRAGEVLETVPGLIISQHSGEGKANQYYLRGFNLDHGTDFATSVAGVPVNMPTHAHGHGYSDVNFLIPELVTGVQFNKGPYSAEEGDFSTAGASHIRYTNTLDRPIVRASAGEDGWGRVLAAATPQMGGGHLLAAVEVGHNDGPWVRPDDYRKANGVIRFSRGDNRNAFSITGMGYSATWDSTDQAPDRAIASGALDRFGGVDDTDGGRTARYSLSADWQRSTDFERDSSHRLRAALSTQSVFELHLLPRSSGRRRPIRTSGPPHGVWRPPDASASRPHRRNGVGIRRRRRSPLRRHQYHRPVSHRRRACAKRRRARMPWVRDRLGSSPSTNCSGHRWLRSNLGLRADRYHFRVDAGDARNGGTDSDGLVSPKASVDARAMEVERALRQLGLRISLQRRPRYDHHRRSCNRRACRSRDPAGASPRRRNRLPFDSNQDDCKRPSHSGASTLTRSCSLSAMPEPQRPAVQVAGMASSGARTTRRSRG